MANAPHLGSYNRLIFKTHAQIKKHALTIARVFQELAEMGSTT